MLPVITIVGRPNVGKSTLFNALTKSRDALVYNEPGVTRDRQYGYGHHEEHAFIIIDTGGIEAEAEHIDLHVQQQVNLAIEAADCIIFMVDGKEGLVSNDQQIAQQLRQLKKPIVIAVNKTDGQEPHSACSEFFELGLSTPLAIAASHKRGVNQLMETTFSQIDLADSSTESPLSQGIKLAIVGRPNVGKSTLINRILGEDRVVVFDEPGTTRDSIMIPLERDGKHYELIDTAGVRRRSKVSQTIEKFSILKTLQAISSAQVVIMVIDASAGIVKQDLHLLDNIVSAGKPLIVAINKWDCLSVTEKKESRLDWPYQLRQVEFATFQSISALHGTGVGNLLPRVTQIYENSIQDLPTSKLTKILNDATKAHTPPIVKARRVKLRYAHQGGKNPPTIVIHGNQTSSLPGAYHRYLVNYFRKVLRLQGTPIKLIMRKGENPYEGKKQKKK